MSQSEIYLTYWNHLPSKSNNRIEQVKQELANLWNKVKEEENKTLAQEKKLFKKDSSRIFNWLLLLSEGEHKKLIEFAISELETLPKLGDITCFEFLSLSRNEFLNKEEVFLALNEKFPKENNVAIFNFQEEVTNPFLLSLSKYGNTLMNGTEIYFNNQDKLANCVSIQQAIKELLPNLGKSTQKQILNFVQKGNLIYLTSLHCIVSMSENLKTPDYFNKWLSTYKEEDERKYDMFLKIMKMVPQIEEERFFKLLEEVPLPENAIGLKDIHFQLFFIVEKCSYKGLDINEKKYNTIKKLHDAVSQIYLRFVKNNDNTYLFLMERFFGLAAMNNSTFTYQGKNYKVVIPEDSPTLVDWGEKMSNCIASYVDQASEGECILFGLEDEEGNIKFNAEWADEQLIQMVSYADKPATRAMQNHFTLFIQRHNIRENRAFNPNNVKKIHVKKEEVKNLGTVYLENKVNKSIKAELTALIEGFPHGSLIEMDHYDIKFILSEVHKIKPNMPMVLLDKIERAFPEGSTTITDVNNTESIISNLKKELLTEDKFILLNLSSHKHSTTISSLLLEIKTLIRNTASVVVIMHDFLNSAIDLAINPATPVAIQSIRRQTDMTIGFEKTMTGAKIIVKKFPRPLASRSVGL